MAKYENIRILRRRIRPDLSMTDFCALSKINTSTLSSIEKGNQRPSPETLEKIGKALDVPAEMVIWECMQSELSEIKQIRHMLYKRTLDNIFLELVKEC